MTDIYLVLHGLAIKKHADAAAVAAAIGLDEAEVQAALDEAVAKGRVMCAGEAYSLTPVARVALVQITVRPSSSKRCRVRSWAGSIGAAWRRRVT